MCKYLIMLVIKRYCKERKYKNSLLEVSSSQIFFFSFYETSYQK